jgi:probable selenium-dependent hydroxylase accessory protein YqeC
LKKACISLSEALDLGTREHIAFVGGGGKTTLLLTLSRELRKNKKRVLTSTTTKLWLREAEEFDPLLFTDSENFNLERLSGELGDTGNPFLAVRKLESGKVEGIDPTLADRIFNELGVDTLLLEADGAAGRPLKAPAGNEPVIPQTATRVVALLGVEALGKKVGPETVFRPDPFETITGLGQDDEINPRDLAALLLNPLGLFRGSPDDAARVVFLNKLDLIKDDRMALELGQLLLDDPQQRIHRVVMGSLKKGKFIRLN